MLNDQNRVEEKELISRLVEGDEMAFEILFYRYRGKVGHFIKRSLPAQFDVEGFVNEIFLRIWINKEKIDPNRPVGPYIFRVARNLVIDELRKKVEQLTYLQDETFYADLGINDTDLNLEEKELQNWFNAVLDKIPEKRKDIFVMSRLEDMTYKEIAQKLDISENTVDTQIRRTLLFLKNEIKRLGVFFFLNL
jgi:RNA polymerase sigma-70 factor (ECF subfamily)